MFFHILYKHFIYLSELFLFIFGNDSFFSTLHLTQMNYYQNWVLSTIRYNFSTITTWSYIYKNSSIFHQNSLDLFYFTLFVLHYPNTQFRKWVTKYILKHHNHKIKHNVKCHQIFLSDIIHKENLLKDRIIISSNEKI